MNQDMAPNPIIQCGVCSCSYHDPSNHCCLDKIHVDPMMGATTGQADDESKCGCYRYRGGM